MAGETVIARRVLVYNGRELADPQPEAGWSPERLMAFYSQMYPELAQATIERTERSGDVIKYHVRKAVGTKGA